MELLDRALTPAIGRKKRQTARSKSRLRPGFPFSTTELRNAETVAFASRVSLMTLSSLQTIALDRDRDVAVHATLEEPEMRTRQVEVTRSLGSNRNST